MKKATWTDIEACLNSDTLEDQNQETLLAFSRVEPPASTNQLFHARFKSAQDRIQNRIRQREAKEQADKSAKKHWTDTAPGKVTTSVVSGVVGGVIMLILTYLLRHWLPFLKD